jgi:cobalt-zinc-cadmium efflux system protein
MAVAPSAGKPILRLFSPEAVAGETVIIARIGIDQRHNRLALCLRQQERSQYRGAYLHMVTPPSRDVVLAGHRPLYTGWLWLDPVVSLLIVGRVLGTWSLLRESLAMSLMPCRQA